MGEVIRKGAAAADIFADVRTTLVKARAMGEPYAAAAEERLAPVVALIDGVIARESEAMAALGPLVADVEAKNDLADRVLGRVSDDVWNDVGRPQSDPALSILFPGGIAYYADGEVDVQPERMEILAELLESGVHPRVIPESARRYARTVREAAAPLRDAVEAARTPKTRVEVLGRVKTAVARAAQIELAGLKRRYRADGLGEVEIHTVIPDRPTVRSKKTERDPAE